MSDDRIPSDSILMGAGSIALTSDQITAIDANSIMRASSWVFRGKGSEPVLTITADGELIFRDVTEAALALKAEWDRIRGAY